MWAVLSWLSVLANIDRSVEKILQAHWNVFGRNFFTRYFLNFFIFKISYLIFSYDYEEIDGPGPFAMLKRLEGMCMSNELIDKTFNTTHGDKQYTIKLMDDFNYTDPVDGSYTEKQGIRIIFSDGSRLVFRLSGTGSRGATVRLYADSYESDPDTFTKDAQVNLLAFFKRIKFLLSFHRKCLNHWFH
jgi:phosphoglucomutase